jgi:hypothetical protein
MKKFFEWLNEQSYDYILEKTTAGLRSGEQEAWVILKGDGNYPGITDGEFTRQMSQLAASQMPAARQAYEGGDFIYYGKIPDSAKKINNKQWAGNF